MDTSTARERARDCSSDIRLFLAWSGKYQVLGFDHDDRKVVIAAGLTLEEATELRQMLQEERA